MYEVRNALRLVGNQVWPCCVLLLGDFHCLQRSPSEISFATFRGLAHRCLAQSFWTLSKEVYDEAIAGHCTTPPSFLRSTSVECVFM
mmetsp:Transcript_19727/g.52719  ORF Transcript_19727/g.52719 Transcript_19727/m.52719 type:complete len:87 (-) Transcript_19727:261-521(-)